MRITVKREKGITIVMASGEIDAVTCGDLQDELEKLIQAGAIRIILDLADVTYISSAGLRVILSTAQKLYGSGAFAISRTTENVRSILEMVGLASIISICDTLDEAREVVAK